MIFYPILVSFTALASSHSPNEPTRNALDLNRLIYVYEDGCRELEGVPLSGKINAPQLHRAIMLDELQRRVNSELIARGAPSRRMLSDSEPLSTIYLQSLEMEIAEVPSGLTILDMETLSTNLPCVKFVSRDEKKQIEKNSKFFSSFDSSEQTDNQTNDPSDPLFQYQWTLKGDHESYGIDAAEAWQTFGWHGAPDMTVAIIDSGCNLDHPDMEGQFWRNEGETDCNDGIDNDGNGFVDDCYGWDFVDNDNNPQAEETSHGTAAAGIIAANSNNGLGISGICWECKIMCVRFISSTEGTVSNEVRAIDYAVKMGAKVSNNSYGGYAHQGSRVEREAIERAARKGHVFVTSAGNNNLATDKSEYIHTPSGYDLENIVSVGASTEQGRKTSFSNFGQRTVHAFAPGRNVISTGISKNDFTNQKIDPQMAIWLIKVPASLPRTLRALSPSFGHVSRSSRLIRPSPRCWDHVVKVET